MSEWISVEDRLPDIGEFVLVAFVLDGIHRRVPTSARYEGRLRWLITTWRHSGGTFEDITHWMPLPNPPEV